MTTPDTTADFEARRAPFLERSIDNTALAAYMRCPREFYYGMVLHRRKKGATRPALAYGTTWHAILEAHYKAQPVDAGVLTPTGWTTIGELQVGDWVMGQSGKPTQVLGVYPQGMLQVFTVTTSDGAQTQCSADHLWSVKAVDNPKKGWQVLNTMDIMKRTFNEYSPGGYKYYHRFQIPLPQAVDYKNNPRLPIHPYVLGCLLGDGYIGGDSATISSSEQDLIDRVRLFLPSSVSIRKSGSNNLGWVIKGSGREGENVVLNGLRELELLGTVSDTKFIPPQYFLAGIEERKALLCGLLDTDGHTRDGTVIYTTVSKQLADGVVAIVQSLGGLARINQQKTVTPGRKQPYLVSMRVTGFTPFILQRKATAYNSERGKKTQVLSRYITEIQPTPLLKQHVCIKVSAEDGLYITDGFIVTHNTGGNLDAVTRAAIMSWEPHDNPDDHRTLERALSEYPKYLARWGDHDTETRAYGKTVGFPDAPVVENPTELWWPGALHPYAGKIDRIYESQGQYYVEDHKTTSALGKTYFRQFDPSNQMMGYAWLAQKLTGVPIAGVRINAHAVLKTESKFERQTVMFTQDRLEDWARNYNRWVVQISNSMKALAQAEQLPPELQAAAIDEAFPYNFNSCAGKYGPCTYVDVDTMPTKIRRRVLDNDYSYEPWDPMNTDGEDEA